VNNTKPTGKQRSNKKLSYRRGTARCVVAVEILPIATQQYTETTCRQTIWCILESNSAALVASVFVYFDFPKKKCNFLHKNKLDIVGRYHLYQ